MVFAQPVGAKSKHTVEKKIDQAKQAAEHFPETIVVVVVVVCCLFHHFLEM